ncbi:hypothetical protein [Winogradskyella costae]|uniref:hypothetical protein n=1 Tax=Winogradskyella costae TaxID=2697008 RepID=UPI0015CC2894|nr:hypothetical protein [Winogradskyella costae]
MILFYNLNRSYLSFLNLIDETRLTIDKARKNNPNIIIAGPASCMLIAPLLPMAIRIQMIKKVDKTIPIIDNAFMFLFFDNI